jgi:hypothetical protein
MLRVPQELVEQVRAATTGDELLKLIQGAVELEFSTIPPYLTAMLSLKPGTNREIWEILHSVVVDEMLHMAVGANLMAALGGGALIDSPGFVPVYPTHLPMAVNTSLVVPLQAYSLQTVEEIFMRIEAPERPLVLKATFAVRSYATIGAFYAALADRLEQLGPDIFIGDPARQLDAPLWFGDRLKPMLKPEDAIKAISELVEEGEGTSTSPLDAQGDVAHYYRFEQLVRGRRLIPDASVPEGFAFRGDPIPFDPGAVFPLTPNQGLDAFETDSQVGRIARQFAFTFTKLLKALHETFNGSPSAFDAAMGLMFELRLAGQRLCAQPIGDGSLHAGPVFAYLTRSS